MYISGSYTQNLPKPTNVFGTPRNWSADARKKGFTFTGAVFKSHLPSLWSPTDVFDETGQYSLDLQVAKDA
jgi:hypothetical protein